MSGLTPFTDWLQCRIQYISKDIESSGAADLWRFHSTGQIKVNGTLEFTSAYATSDRRWKKEIRSLSEPLAAILHLNGVCYLWNRDEFPEKGFCENPQIGLIAQEVEKILPEIVKTDGEVIN